MFCGRVSLQLLCHLSSVKNIVFFDIILYICATCAKAYFWPLTVMILWQEYHKILKEKPRIIFVGHDKEITNSKLYKSFQSIDKDTLLS